MIMRDDLGVAEIGDRCRCAMCRPLRRMVSVVAEGAHLAQAVRDEDDGDALGAFSARDDLAQPVDVAARQGRGRLVEQEDARLAEEGAGDLDLLPDGEVERRATSSREVDIVKPSAVEMRARPALSAGAPPDEADRIDRRVGQQHVLEDRQVADQRHLLEGGLDAEGDGRRAAERAGSR